MSLLKGKISQRSAIGLSSVALVVAIAAPNAVMAQSITLNRCPASSGTTATTNCTSQIAIPIAANAAAQKADSDP